MRRLWPLTVRGTGALVIAVTSFIVANEAGIAELMYFGILLIAVVAASIPPMNKRERQGREARGGVPMGEAVWIASWP